MPERLAQVKMRGNPVGMGTARMACIRRLLGHSMVVLYHTDICALSRCAYSWGRGILPVAGGPRVGQQLDGTKAQDSALPDRLVKSELWPRFVTLLQCYGPIANPSGPHIGHPYSDHQTQSMIMCPVSCNIDSLGNSKWEWSEVYVLFASPQTWGESPGGQVSGQLRGNTS